MKTKRQAKTITPGLWHVMADPMWAGKHPLHEARYVTTDVQTEKHINAHGEETWQFEDPAAVIICTMPDSENQRENARAIAAVPVMLAVLERCQRLCAEALPKFDWGSSALDANAIQLLNEVPYEIDAILAKLKGE